MKRIFLLLWLLPVLAFSQLTVTGGSSLDLDTLLPIIADSSKWTDGSTVNAIKPRDGKTVEADSAKVGALEVTGNARFNSNVTMVTTAGEQVQLGTGSDAAPELSSAGDLNTGIRFPGSDVTTFVQGGAEKVRIGAAGNVGIGATGNEALHVYKNTPASNQYIFQIATSDDTSRFAVDEDGDLFLDGTITLLSSQYISGISANTGMSSEDDLYFSMDNNNNDAGTRFISFGTNNAPEAATPLMRLLETGNLGLGTTTPYNQLSVVNSSSGQGTGIGLTSSQWNKSRTSWATASDTSAIGLYIDSAGGPRWFMRAVNGDTLSITLSGSFVNIATNAMLQITATTYFNGSVVPRYTDATTLGSAGLRYQSLSVSDNIYLGGKGQTATQYISKEATIAGQDSSITTKIGSDGNPYVRYAAADGDSARIHVRSDSTEFYSKNALALDVPAVVVRGNAVINDSVRVNKTSKLIGNVEIGTGTGWFTAEDSLLAVVGDISLDGFKVSKIDTVFTATYVPRWVKYTSGTKSWYCPVYADTTGKW